jgi:hypothetical protein
MQGPKERMRVLSPHRSVASGRIPSFASQCAEHNGGSGPLSRAKYCYSSILPVAVAIVVSSVSIGRIDDDAADAGKLPSPRANLTCDRDPSPGGTVTALGNPAQTHDSRQLAQGRHNSSVGLSLRARCDATNIGDEAQTQPHPLQSSPSKPCLLQGRKVRRGSGSVETPQSKRLRPGYGKRKDLEAR